MEEKIFSKADMNAYRFKIGDIVNLKFGLTGEPCESFCCDGFVVKEDINLIVLFRFYNGYDHVYGLYTGEGSIVVTALELQLVLRQNGGGLAEVESFTAAHNAPVTEKALPVAFYNRLRQLGIIPCDVRSANIGKSDYCQHIIQPWAIWQEYGLNPWDADIVKRVLRHKDGDSRRMEYEKIIHICQERIRQIDCDNEEENNQ